MMTADTFYACEIFEIAEQIERNAAKFYRRALEMFDDKDVCDTLRKLGNWEKEHERVFAGMKERLADSDSKSGWAKARRVVGDPKAMAGLAVFGIRSDPRDELGEMDCRDDVLRMAVEKERQSVVFYQGLKDFAADEVGAKQIGEIIDEEGQHIAILSKLLE